MKSKYYSWLFILVIIGIFYHHTEVTIEVVKAVTLFREKVFPSLFPFLVLSPFFIQYGMFEFIKKYIGPILKKFFRISENGAYLFVMSIFSGFPSSAMYAKNLCEKNLLEEKEAFHILLFSHFSNPIFILTMVSSHPYLVLTAHYLANIIIGFFLRFSNHPSPSTVETSVVKKNFFSLFTEAIKSTMENALFILGVIVFFFMMDAILPFSITHYLLELSQGLYYLQVHIPSSMWIATLSAFLLSFGGFSVHLQTYGILSELHFSYIPYFLTRVIHGLLSASLVFFYLYLTV